jgi:hypothetical protein
VSTDNEYKKYLHQKGKENENHLLNFIPIVEFSKTELIGVVAMMMEEKKEILETHARDLKVLG